LGNKEETKKVIAQSLMSAHLSVDLPSRRMTCRIPPNTPDMQILACTSVPEIASAEVLSLNQVIGAGWPGVGQTSESPTRDCALPLVGSLTLSCAEGMHQNKSSAGLCAMLRVGFTGSTATKTGSTDRYHSNNSRSPWHLAESDFETAKKRRKNREVLVDQS